MELNFQWNDKTLAQLCKYIALSAQQKTDIIDDVHTATDTTLSSYAIDQLMKNLTEELKGYSDELLAGLTKLRYVLTTEQPTLANTEEGIVYLFSATGQHPYIQYLKISSTQLINLGSTDISMDDFYTKTQADGKFASASTVNLLSDAVTGKVSVNQGTAKAGQILMVSEAGIVTPVPFETENIDWTS